MNLEKVCSFKRNKSSSLQNKELAYKRKPIRTKSRNVLSLSYFFLDRSPESFSMHKMLTSNLTLRTIRLPVPDYQQEGILFYKQGSV